MKQSVSASARKVRSTRLTCPLCVKSLLLIPLISLLGCHQMTSPYGGYGNGYGYQQYPTYPSYPQTIQPGYQYQQPIQTLTPGQPYVPSGTTIQPGTVPNTYSNPSGGLQPIPENSDAPPFNSSDSGQNVDVPDPYFNSTSIQGVNSATGIQPTNHFQEPAPLNPPANGLREVQLPTQSAPVSQTASNPFGGAADYNPVPVTRAATPQESIPSLSADDQFAMPIQAPESSASQATAVFADPEPASAPSSPPNISPPPVIENDPFALPTAPPQEELPADPPEFAEPVNFSVQKPVAELTAFGHDPNYKWLRGVVTRHPSDRNWSLVFKESPDGSDEFAGCVTLAPSPSLENLTDGTTIEIQGELDPVVKDSAGKPVYLISNLSVIHSATD
ncbi:MAG: hypothetical protein KDA80_07690 [Planctomycetaceae bacterium]|nr:hypothetical protein [Planctomycetaceae bacterium]